MRKRIIWIIITALITAYAILTWVQYDYYDRVLTLRKESIHNQMQEALSEVAGELQVRELVRYLNKGLLKDRDRFRDEEFLPSTVADFDIWRRSSLDTITIKRLIEKGHVMLKMPTRRSSLQAEYRPTDYLIHRYFSDLHSLDKYILKYVYDSYQRDSIPQMVNVRLLKSLLREHLDSKNLYSPFRFALYDYQGKKIYEYRPPETNHGDGWADESMVTQYLFVPTDGSTADRPYIQLSQDIAPTKARIARLALPSFISTVIVLILGFSSLWVLLKHMSFSSQRSSFINNMTHELKTPVSTVALTTQALRAELTKEGAQPKALEAVNIIALENQRMKYLIDKVLHFSILESETGQVAIETLEVNELLLPVAEIYTFKAQQLGGDLSLDLEAINTWIYGNQMHLMNVFFNVLENALKYGKEGVAPQLAIATADEGDYLRVTIADNGIGIGKKELRHVFDRFYRVAPTGKQHETRGFGIGLAYVASVIKQCGGHITAESELGVGTKMHIYLRVADEA